jgi:hypothetical protein
MVHLEKRMRNDEVFAKITIFYLLTALTNCAMQAKADQKVVDFYEFFCMFRFKINCYS